VAHAEACVSRYRYCPVCAQPLVALPDGHRDAGRSACVAGHFVDYDNPAVTAFAFVERDGLYLALRRAEEPYAGEWDLPGGFVESGESPPDSVRREIREETGLEVGELEVIGAYASAYGAGRWTVDVGYRCSTIGGELALSAEKSAAAWHALEELPPLAFAGERSALAALRG